MLFNYILESVLDGTGDIVCDMRVSFTVSQSRGGVCALKGRRREFSNPEPLQDYCAVVSWHLDESLELVQLALNPDSHTSALPDTF